MESDSVAEEVAEGGPGDSEEGGAAEEEGCDATGAVAEGAPETEFGAAFADVEGGQDADPRGADTEDKGDCEAGISFGGLALFGAGIGHGAHLEHLGLGKELREGGAELREGILIGGQAEAVDGLDLGDASREVD